MTQANPETRNGVEMRTLIDSGVFLTCRAVFVTRESVFLAVCMMALISLIVPVTVHAEEDVTFSGFMSIVGGKVLSGSRTTPFNNVDCPCFVASWNTLSPYNHEFSLRQESRVGARMNAKLNESLVGVVQVDARDTSGSSGTSLEWVYLSYTPSAEWTVQAGRKRLPIYYYSDFMDVGFAYPWVRPPQDLYGWEVNNFNGITLARIGHWNDWSSRASVFYGQEESHSNVLTSYFYPGMHADLTWRDILGADLELTHDWFNVRMVYIQSKVDIRSSIGGTLVDGGEQRIYGLAANIDYDNWLVRSEISQFDRWQDMGYKSKAGMIGVGYHMGKFTPMVTYSGFHDDNSYGYPNAIDDSLALTLRYDVNATSSIKLQYDKYRELSTPDTTSGNAKVISMSFDKVF